MTESSGRIDWGRDLPGIDPLKKVEKLPQPLKILEKLLVLLSNGKETDTQFLSGTVTEDRKPRTSFAAGLANNHEIKALIDQIRHELDMKKFGLFSKTNMEQMLEQLRKIATERTKCYGKILKIFDEIAMMPLEDESLKSARVTIEDLNTRTANIIKNLDVLGNYIQSILDRIDIVVAETNKSETNSEQFFKFLANHPECVNPKSITEFLDAKLQEQKEKINHPDNTSLNKYKKSWKETLHILREKSSGNKIFFVGLEDFIKNHLQNFSEELGASIKDEIQQFAAEIDDRVRVEGMLNPKSKK